MAMREIARNCELGLLQVLEPPIIIPLLLGT